MKALWKLRRGLEGTFIYSGRASVTSFTGERPNASIQGPIVQLVRQARLPPMLSYKRKESEERVRDGSCARCAVLIMARCIVRRSTAAILKAGVRRRLDALKRICVASSLPKRRRRLRTLHQRVERRRPSKWYA